MTLPSTNQDHIWDTVLPTRSSEHRAVPIMCSNLPIPTLSPSICRKDGTAGLKSDCDVLYRPDQPNVNLVLHQPNVQPVADKVGGAKSFSWTKSIWEVLQEECCGHYYSDRSCGSWLGNIWFSLGWQHKVYSLSALCTPLYNYPATVWPNILKIGYNVRK